MKTYKQLDQIDPKTFLKLTQYYPDFDEEDIDGFKFIEKTIESSDQDDGGGAYEMVIQRISDGKYFKLYYSDWDVDNTDYDYDTETVGERCDLNCSMIEVFPKEITKIIYE